MRFSFTIIILLISVSAWANNRNCNLSRQINEHLAHEEVSRRSEFGMGNDSARVYPPNRCTPFMQDAKFIPLSKRNVAGANRERYMDADCNVYEWDSQHGNFENYVSNGNSLVHVGDVSPFHGIENTGKARSTRNYNDNNTGYAGMDLNRLCKDYKRNRRLTPTQAKGLQCR